jgi:hypothetical protein
MAWVRVTLATNAEPSEALLRIGRLRSTLWRGGFRIDPALGAHRSEAGRLYFELETDDPDHLTVVVRKAESDAVVSVLSHEPESDECINCGNRTGGMQPAVCPACAFHEISDCPHCGHANARASYRRAEGDLFQCPHCNRRVRLQFADPLFNEDGTYRQPVVTVIRAGDAA